MRLRAFSTKATIFHFALMKPMWTDAKKFNLVPIWMMEYLLKRREDLWLYRFKN